MVIDGRGGMRQGKSAQKSAVGLHGGAARLPVGHDARKRGVKSRGVVGVQKMRQLVRDDIFDAASGTAASSALKVTTARSGRQLPQHERIVRILISISCGTP